ncbi:hypothetical protein AA101099_0533 [Neoasaia chiangmaiensis NBRC 101099]|uniref:CopG family transcriptional regulator n=1 Tax=Neoasaia chiangmaiensis TaxID=320497 RepID=A0A1U9KTM1_9PROT|nr:CopG family transcriptional regulator [Neoasaia chiangmaiensis]AQS89082.1 CopG family transcriptional regulator [Neoasaia chiangmaiensis]GBR36962.1 hypothetical protein AA101099_0533 [Neoasaia chiangmaiensis NBRC 101099]GEN16577.1 CopG family transcriptional regulator [Neoasaia chiangmaiensis]
MSARRKKRQMTVYLDPVLSRAIGEMATRRRQSGSLVVETALAAFFTPEDDAAGEAATGRRLDRMERRLGRLERDVGIGVETLAMFIRFWMVSNPPLPEPLSAAAQAQAAERYERFLEMLGRRLSTGQRLHGDLRPETDS